VQDPEHLFRVNNGGNRHARIRSASPESTDIGGIDTYPAKTKGGPNCFDHMIATVEIMPSRIRVADTITPKLSDHAALVAEWKAAGRKLEFT
jgi:hypothetical protein